MLGTRKKIYPLVIATLFSLWLAAQANAQAAATITVNDEIVIERPDGVSLDIYFTLRDGDGQAIPQAQVQSAAILLEDGTQAEAEIDKPPYYMALVVDTSGSMQDVLEEVRQAALGVVASAPAEVQFAVIQFDENIRLVRPFSSDHQQAIDAVNQLSTMDGGTCLYDVAYTAVEALEQISRDAPRRSMLLFTDGRDEKQQGFRAACSRKTYEQLLAFAVDRRVPVPIHTIGIASSQRRINSADLRELSRATGGLSAIGPLEAVRDPSSQGETSILEALYQHIMADVESQWVARAALLPTQGYHRGALFVNLADGSLPLSAPVSLASSRSFQPPPEPVSVVISDFVYSEPADLFLFDLSLSSFQQVGSLRVEVVDSQNNLQVEQLIFNNPTLRQQIRLGTVQLSPGRSYLARVTPLSPAGNTIEAESGGPLIAEHPFGYDPPLEMEFNLVSLQIKDEPPQLDLGRLRIEDDEAELTLNMRIRNGENLARIEGRLISQLGNQQVGEFSLAPPAETVRLPLAGLGIPSGSGDPAAYTMIVTALAGDGSVLAAGRQTFTYTPQETPLIRALRALQANPTLYLLAGVLMLVALVVGWLIGVARGRRLARAMAQQELELDEALESVSPEEATSSDGHPRPRGMPLVKLRVVESPDPSVVNGDGREISRFPYTIGREGCDLTIAGDPHISRKHAKIIYDNGIFYILDAGSSNGTFVNEARVAVNVPTPLSTDIGAKIRIGKTTHVTFSEVVPDNV
jgi:Mg-chelatase subunit ChlD